MDEGIDSCSMSVKRKIRNLKFLRIWSSFDETMSSARERNSSYTKPAHWTIDFEFSAMAEDGREDGESESWLAPCPWRSRASYAPAFLERDFFAAR
jgi:hypothetical protein